MVSNRCPGCEWYNRFGRNVPSGLILASSTLVSRNPSTHLFTPQQNRSRRGCDFIQINTRLFSKKKRKKFAFENSSFSIVRIIPSARCTRVVYHRRIAWRKFVEMARFVASRPGTFIRGEKRKEKPGEPRSETVEWKLLRVGKRRDASARCAA